MFFYKEICANQSININNNKSNQVKNLFKLKDCHLYRINEYFYWLNILFDVELLQKL